MGGSSKSSSSSSSNTTNKSSSIALDGDNHGLMLAGVENSEVIFQQTDHGAIEAAGKVASEALEINGQVSTEAINSMESTAAGAMNFGNAIIQQSLDTVQDTAAKSADANNRQLEALTNLAKSVQTAGQTDIAGNMTKVVYATMASIAVIGAVIAYQGSK